MIDTVQVITFILLLLFFVIVIAVHVRFRRDRKGVVRGLNESVKNANGRVLEMFSRQRGLQQKKLELSAQNAKLSTENEKLKEDSFGVAQEIRFLQQDFNDLSNENFQLSIKIRKLKKQLKKANGKK